MRLDPWVGFDPWVGKIPCCGEDPWVGKIPAVQEGTATHTSILAWRIPWTEDPGGLQSMGSQRVGHDRSDLACIHISTLFCISFPFRSPQSIE